MRRGGTVGASVSATQAAARTESISPEDRCRGSGAVPRNRPSRHLVSPMGSSQRG
jgi:hypothetical protein